MGEMYFLIELGNVRIFHLMENDKIINIVCCFGSIYYFDSPPSNKNKKNKKASKVRSNCTEKT